MLHGSLCGSLEDRQAVAAALFVVDRAGESMLGVDPESYKHWYTFLATGRLPKVGRPKATTRPTPPRGQRGATRFG